LARGLRLRRALQCCALPGPLSGFVCVLAHAITSLLLGLWITKPANWGSLNRRRGFSCFYGISRAPKKPVHSTFFQKVIICAVAALAAAGLIEWGKVFGEGADKALNGGYEHRTVMGSEKK
jgi:hypothetical protein